MSTNTTTNVEKLLSLGNPIMTLEAALDYQMCFLCGTDI